MNAAINEIRAMLALFGKSPYRDLHVRAGSWEIFLAKSDGAANPMVTAADIAPDEIGVTFDAPHLGLFFASVAAGDPIAVGTVFGQIELLGGREDLIADRAGEVAAILAVDGALVEYGMPLVRFAA